MRFTRYLQGFSGTSRKKAKAYTRYHRLNYVFQKRWEDWALDLYMISVRLYLPNFGGDSEQLPLLGLTLCGLHTEKNVSPQWCNEKGVLKSGKRCWKPEIL